MWTVTIQTSYGMRHSEHETARHVFRVEAFTMEEAIKNAHELLARQPIKSEAIRATQDGT